MRGGPRQGRMIVAEQPKPSRKRAFVGIPADWDKLSDAQKRAASAAMATELQRQLGKPQTNPKESTSD